jgi:hypothetical protein
VTGAVYKIINSPELAESQGVLELAMLETILEKKAESDYDYPPEQYRFIIGLMEKFELCYPLVKSSRVLVPDLLAVQEPDADFDYDTALRFIVEYDFLPRSVMPRFIVNMYRDIKQNLQWRTGVVLEDRDFEAQALVRADNEARRIYIYVTGSQKRDYFAALLLTLRRINSSFEKLKTSELVPMPDNPEITAPYKQLVKCEKRGYEYYLHAESDKEYLVKDLLGTIIGEKAATEEEILRYLKEALAAAKDTKESPAKILKDTLILQPNIFGVGINISKIFDKLLSRQKKGDKTN